MRVLTDSRRIVRRPHHGHLGGSTIPELELVGLVVHSGEKTGGRLTRLGNPNDIASAALWLSSDDEFVTGSFVTADGGFSIKGDAIMSS